MFPIGPNNWWDWVDAGVFGSSSTAGRRSGFDLAAATWVERCTSKVEEPSGALTQHFDLLTVTATNGSDKDAEPRLDSVLCADIPDLAISSPCPLDMVVTE